MQSIPVSVEAVDKEHQAGPSKPMAKKNPPASKKNNESRSVEGRQNPTAKQDLPSPGKSELRPTELLTKTETGDDKEREMTQRPEEGTGFVVMKVGGNDTRIIKAEKIGSVLIQTNDASELSDC